MYNLGAALIIDLLCLGFSTLLLIRFGRISFMHPAALYLLFHFYECTQRLILLNVGAAPSELFAAQPITNDQMEMAVWCFDLALCSVTAASIIAAQVDLRANGRLPKINNLPPSDIVPKYFWYVLWVILPLGVIGIVQNLHSSHGAATGTLRIESHLDGEWSSSYASTMNQSWIGLCFMPLFFIYGPKKWVLGGFVLASMAIIATGILRWRYELPLIFICYTYLSTKGWRWPPVRISVLLLLTSIFFLPSKDIGSCIVSGKYDSISDSVQAGFSQWLDDQGSGSNEDTEFLDITAAVISQAEKHGKLYLGQAETDAVVQFIPRPLWKNKPNSGIWEREISTAVRPLSTYGMAPSLPGAAYVDFGLAGVVFVPFILLFLMSKMYFNAYRKNNTSITRFTYLLFACSMLQVYRDGVSSILVFDFINFWPLMLIVVLHKIFPKRRIFRPKIDTRDSFQAEHFDLLGQKNLTNPDFVGQQ